MGQGEPENRPGAEDILRSAGAFAQRLDDVRRQLEAHLHQREAEVARLAETLAATRAELEAATAESKRLQALEQRHASDLETLQNAQLQWAVDREGLLQQRQEAEAARAQAQREYDQQLEQRTRELLARIEEAASSRAQSEQEQTRQLAQRTAERDAADTRASALQKDLEQSRAADQKLRDTLAQLGEQQGLAARERKQMVADVGRLEQQALELQATLKKERADREGLQHSHALLERDLEAFERRESQRHDQLTRSQKERDSMAAQLGEVQAEQNRLRASSRELEQAVKAAEQQLEIKQREQQQWSEAQAKLLAEMMEKEQDAAAREQKLLTEKRNLAIDLERLQSRLSELASGHQDVLRRKEAEWAELEVAFSREKEGLRGRLDDLKKALDEERQRLQQDTSEGQKAWEAERVELTAEVEALRDRLAAHQQAAESGAVTSQSKDFEAKFRLIYDQSHDLNSPLNAIIGFSELLLDDKTATVGADEKREFLEHIHESGKALLHRIRELIDFAKEEAGITEKSASPDAVREAGGAVAELVAARVGTGKGPVILVADNDPTVKERIEPFLSHAGYEMVYASTAQEALRLAAQLRPLAVLIDTQLPPKGGSALLYDLKREVKTRDIPVVLTSKVNKEQLGFDVGSCDFLVKPIDRQQLLQMMVKFDLMADGKQNKVPTKILLVDDDPQNIRLVKAMLGPYGFTILSARAGNEGIKLAQTEKPDLLILDLMMPDVDGFAVVQAIKHNPETAQIPILIYTAKNITQEDRARLQGNIESIIQKGDFGKERFLELINGLQAAQAS
jgi:CheY-like chemotaxis protein